MEEIKRDISEIKGDITDIKVTMAKNTAELEIHIKRSDAMQDMLEEFKNRVIFVDAAVKLIAVGAAIILFLNELGILKKLF